MCVYVERAALHQVVIPVTDDCKPAVAPRTDPMQGIISLLINSRRHRPPPPRRLSAATAVASCKFSNKAEICVGPAFPTRRNQYITSNNEDEFRNTSNLWNSTRGGNFAFVGGWRGCFFYTKKTALFYIVSHLCC